MDFTRTRPLPSPAVPRDTATAASPVGTYTVVPEWYGAANYTITLRPGVITIVPRPTSL